MTDLASLECVPCRGGEKPLDGEEIDAYLKDVPGWQVMEKRGIQRLVKSYDFDNFREALSFTNRVGEIAEEVDHHPLLETAWGEVKVSWWTHVINGLHRNDFIMAARTDHLYQG